MEVAKDYTSSDRNNYFQKKICASKRVRKRAGKDATKERSKKGRKRRRALTDDGHALSVAVEVQESEHLVRAFCSHLADGDGVLRTRQEHEAETASRCDQSTFVRGRGLIHQFT